MATKTAQLQIRLTQEQKRRLGEAARRAGQDMSSYVLSRVLPSASLRLSQILEKLEDDSRRRFALASLNDLLHALSPVEFGAAVAEMDLRPLDAYLQNYVSAMVEHAAHRKQVPAPRWTRDVEPLDTPHFVTPLKGLRPHLLRSSPVAFRRRNVFVDSSVGDRV